MRRELHSVWMGLVAVALLAGCQTSSGTAKGSGPREPGSPPDTGHRLGPGDVVEVRVFREPDLAGIYQINERGAVDFPLVGELRLLGKSPDEVASELRTRLADGYLVDPQVAVYVRERHSRKVHVLGEVNKPGTFAFDVGMSVIQAITVAGGFTKLAAANSVRVTREKHDRPFVIRVGDIRDGAVPNFLLEPGDIIYVPEALF